MTIEALNRALFLTLNGQPETPAWLIATATAIADELILAIPCLLLWFWLRGDEARRRIAVKSCLVAFAALGINQLIGLVWQHPRPFAIGLGHTFIPHASDSSFPSDHMTVFAAIGITLLLDKIPRWGAVVTASGVAVAWARIFLGVHFPLDMVGAVAVSGIVYTVVTPAWNVAGNAVMPPLLTLYRRLCAKPIAAGWLRD